MMKRFLSQHIINIFYIYSVLGVNAILSRAFSGINGNFEWLVRENITRIIVPIIFLIASYCFFRVKFDDWKIYKKAYLDLLRKGGLVYIIYTGIWIFFTLLPYGFSCYVVKKAVQLLVTGGAPCTWMILAYLVGLGLVIFLRQFGISVRSVIIISFLLHLVSISSETYFHLFYDEGNMAEAFTMYSRYFLTTRNGLFYGFFWCAIGLSISKIRSVMLKSIRWKMFFLSFLCLLLMLGEHYYAYIHYWPRDYKSSFMLIPTSVCAFLFLITFELPHFSDRYKFFRDWMFIAFLLIPSVEWLVSHYIFCNNPLFEFYCLTLISLVCSYLVLCLNSKLRFNLFNQSLPY